MNNQGGNEGNGRAIDSTVERGVTPQTFRDRVQGGVQPQRIVERDSGEKPPARD